MFCITTIFGFILFFSFSSFLQEDITYQSASRDLSKKLSQQFFHATEEHQTKCQVWFAYLLPISNTKHEHMVLTTYNVCNNTEINIKKRCYNTQVYTQHQQLFNHSFFYQRKCFSSKLAMTIVIFP